MSRQIALALEITPRQRELIDAANGWRQYAATAKPEGLARVSIAAAVALEREAADGIARCACCMKPMSNGGRY